MTHRALAEILESLDEARFRAGFAQLFPHLPQPKEADTLATMHMARTQSEAVAFAARAYSHSWLLDRGMPSQLPDELKPKAERTYPTKAYAVGLAVKSTSGARKAHGLEIRRFMERAVLECDADGRLLDHDHVTKRIDEARKKGIQFVYG